jgi:hypothetical protein
MARRSWAGLVRGLCSRLRLEYAGRSTCVSVWLACAAIAFAAGKHDGWQTGMVLDSQDRSYFAADTAKLKASGRYATFVIEDETYAYLVEERLRWRRSRPAKLAPNVPVTFKKDEHRVLYRDDDGRKHETLWHKLFVIDNDSREHEMEIVKKVLKTCL